MDNNNGFLENGNSLNDERERSDADSRKLQPETASDTADITAPAEAAASESIPNREEAPEAIGTPTAESTPKTESPRQTVYVNSTPYKPEKKAKAKLSIGAAIAIVLICAFVSGISAFTCTAIANIVTGRGFISGPAASGGSNGTGEPSVIFQTVENGNRTPGTYAQVAAAVSDSVVEITTESIVTDSVFWGGNYVTSGAGSGVIVSSDGVIITNNHVVSGASTITVRLTDSTEYEAKVIGTDSDSDIAVIKIQATDLKFAVIGDSDKLVVGEEVLAVGNPLGKLGGTVTNGIISALSRDVSIGGMSMTLLQTNAAVNPGNSGGGLFNMYGELIGIVNAKSSTTSSGTSVEGIGFAIPSNTAVKVATELANYGYVRGKAMIGITYIDITNSYDAMYYRVNSLGVYVASSDVEGLESGDRIVAVNGDEVTYGADVKAALKHLEVGAEITVTVVRNGKYVEVPVTLREYVPETASAETSNFEFNFGK